MSIQEDSLEALISTLTLLSTYLPNVLIMSLINLYKLPLLTPIKLSTKLNYLFASAVAMTRAQVKLKFV